MLKLMLRLFAPIEIAGAIFLSPLLTRFPVNRSIGISPFVFILFCTLGIISFTLAASIFIYETGTYLRLSSDGIEYHRWPFTTIKGRWNETEKIFEGTVKDLSFTTLMIRTDKPGLTVSVGGGML